MKEITFQDDELDSILSFLASVEIFSSLAPEDLGAILKKAHPKEAEQGELLLLQGVPSEGFLLLLSGSAVAILHMQDGSQTQIGILEPGETLGEMGLLSQKPRSASLYACEPTRLLWFDTRAFQSLLSEVPGFSLALARTLSERLRASLERILEISSELAAAQGRASELESILMGLRAVPSAPASLPPPSAERSQDNRAPHVYHNSTIHIHHHYYGSDAAYREPQG